MPSAPITSLTNLATMQPSMLLYAAISPFDATDDRKITASNLLTTITPLTAGTQALTITANAIPTVPTLSFNNSAGTIRIQIDPSNTGSLTDSFDALSMFSGAATARDFGAGIWRAKDDGTAAYTFWFAGVAGTDYLKAQCQGGGGANINFGNVPHSALLLASTTTSGGMILCTDVAAPIIFATGGHLFTSEKGRFDASGLTLGKASSITGQLNLAASGSANLQSFQAGTAPASALTFQWPNADPAANQVLTGAAPVAGIVTLTWTTPAGGVGTGNVAQVLTTYNGAAVWVTPFNVWDVPPATPNASNEEMNAALNVAWTWQASAGVPTNQSLGDWVNTQPAAPSYNVNSNIPSALVIMPATTGRQLKVYRGFAPGAGTEWAVATKMSLVASAGANDRCLVALAKEAIPSSGSDEPTDGVDILIRNNNTGYEAQFVRWNGGVGTVVTIVGLSPNTELYAAFTAATSNAITGWISTNGINWTNLGTVSGLNINGNVNTVWMAARSDVSASTIGAFEMIRFLTGNANLWALGMGN